MAQQVFPTKSNLMATKRSLALATQGYDLMDRKRNILVREMMQLIDRAALSSGKTRTNVATRFLAEPEGRRKIIGDIYLRFLRRDPTANEANGWVSQLAANKTEVDVGIALVSSTEYFNRPSS